MAEAAESVEDLRFITGSASAITETLWPAIEPSLRWHYKETLVSRTEPEVDYFADRIKQETWINPSLAPNTRSRYRGTKAIVAMRQGNQLSAFARASYNASSQREGAVGTIEELAKLYSPVNLPGLPLVESRYVNIREIVGNEDEAIMGGMTAYLLSQFDSNRTLTQFLYSDERYQRLRSERWGLEAAIDPETGLEIFEDVYEFGPDAPAERQTKMVGETVGDVIETITSEPAAANALAYIQDNVQKYYGQYIIAPRLMH